MTQTQNGIIYRNLPYFDVKELYKAIESDFIVEVSLYTTKVPFFQNLSKSLAAVSTARILFISSRTPFDDKNELHASLLHALYFSITKTTEAPPRFGPQWEVIGFQGKDPISDLRSTGLLGLMFPFHLFANYPKISQSILTAAHTPGTEFPMMIVLITCADATINVGLQSNILLQAQSPEEGFQILGLFFAGIVSKIANRWIQKKMNFVQHYSIFDEIAQECTKDPMATMTYAAENNI